MLGDWKNIDNEVLVSFAKSEQFYLYVFGILTYKKIIALFSIDDPRTEAEIY